MPHHNNDSQPDTSENLPALSGEGLAALLGGLTTPLLVHLENGEVAWLNEAMVKLLGRRRTSAVGRDISNLPIAGLTEYFDHGKTYRLCDPVTGRVRARTHLLALNPHPITLVALEPLEVPESNVLSFGRDEPLRDPWQISRRPGFDPASGLQDRAAVMQVLLTEVSRSRRYGNPLSVLLVSVAVNDGVEAIAPRPAGTERPYRIMVEVGRILQEDTRWADNVGRWDASEYLMVLPETELGAAQVLWQKLRSRFLEAVPDALVTSGAAEWERGDDATLLLRRARGRLPS